MAAVTGNVRRVSASFAFSHVTIDLMDAHKPVEQVVQESGISDEHVIGAEMSNVGSLQSSWRYVGSAGPRNTPCDALSYVPAQIPWGTAIAGRGTASGIACRFDPAYFHSMTGIGEEWSERHLRACQDLTSANIREILRKIYCEIRSPGFASDVMVSSLSHIILVELARYFHMLGDPMPDGMTESGTLGKHELLRLRDLVENGLHQRLSIRDLAHTLGYSEGYFHALFKRTTGTTPHRYIEMVRIRKAVELILQNRLSLKQIAYAVGFSSPSSFSAAFRKSTGIRPSQATEFHLEWKGRLSPASTTKLLLWS